MGLDVGVCEVRRTGLNTSESDFARLRRDLDGLSGLLPQLSVVLEAETLAVEVGDIVDSSS